MKALFAFFHALFFPVRPEADEARLPDAEDAGEVVTEDEPEAIVAAPDPVEPAPTIPEDTTPPDPAPDSVFSPPSFPPPPEPEPEPEPAPEPRKPDPVGIRSVGVWAGQSSLRNPVRDVKFCVDHNIDRLTIIVNDHSRSRSERDFDTYDHDKIVRLAKEALGAGMKVNLMTWMMPHEKYIRQAASALIKLLDDTGADGIEIDAEEPWTLAKNGMGYQAAADLIEEVLHSQRFRFSPRAGRMGDRTLGVNFIGYTPVSKVGPLAAYCDYWMPQAYSTSSSKQRPDVVVPKFVRRTRDRFGIDKEIRVGLAAYRQNGIVGHTPKSAMAAALAGAQALEGVTDVTYWSLSWIRKTRNVRNFIKGIEKV